MYRRILLAYNGTTYATAALGQGAELARLCGAELHLLGIIPAMSGFALAQAVGSHDVMGAEQQQLRTALEDAARQIVGSCSALHSVMRTGEPAAEIIAYAREIKADLTVIGHRDRSYFARWFTGSTSERLLRELPCNLLIANAKTPA